MLKDDFIEKQDHYVLILTFYAIKMSNLVKKK